MSWQCGKGTCIQICLLCDPGGPHHSPLLFVKARLKLGVGPRQLIDAHFLFCQVCSNSLQVVFEYFHRGYCRSQRVSDCLKSLVIGIKSFPGPLQVVCLRIIARCGEYFRYFFNGHINIIPRFKKSSQSTVQWSEFCSALKIFLLRHFPKIQHFGCQGGVAERFDVGVPDGGG